MTRLNACLRSLTVCALLTAAMVAAGTRIVAAQSKEPPTPNAEETQRDVEYKRVRSRADYEKMTPQRFVTLMRLYAPENRPLINEMCNTREKRDAFLNELDRLYSRLIENGDIDAFQSIADIDSHVAASIGVFGVMEIANKNYMLKPSSKRLREQSLDMLGGFTSHSSPDVRSAALYALGVMRQHDFKDLVISRLGDTARSNLFFPPFIESNYGMDTSVHTQARQTLVKMLGKTEAIPIIQSESRKAFSKSKNDSGENKVD